MEVNLETMGCGSPYVAELCPVSVAGEGDPFEDEDSEEDAGHKYVEVELDVAGGNPQHRVPDVAAGRYSALWGEKEREKEGVPVISVV